MKSQTGYKGGKKDGRVTEWHESGQMKLQDKGQGSVTKWHENGQLMYRQGETHSPSGVTPFTEWYDNGQMKTRGSYKTGLHWLNMKESELEKHTRTDFRCTDRFLYMLKKQ